MALKVPRFSDTDDCTTPVPLGWSANQVYHFAERMAAQLHCRPGANLDDLVVRLGGRIAYTSSKQPVNQLEAMRTAGDTFSIFLDLDTSPLRDRFVIAHELGHWFLHYRNPDVQGMCMGCSGDVRNMHTMRYSTGQATREANWFSAAFLMPAIEFRELFRATHGDIAYISYVFKVPLRYAIIRAQAVGLSTPVKPAA